MNPIDSSALSLCGESPFSCCLGAYTYDICLRLTLIWPRVKQSPPLSWFPTVSSPPPHTGLNSISCSESESIRVERSGPDQRWTV